MQHVNVHIVIFLNNKFYDVILYFISITSFLYLPNYLKVTLSFVGRDYFDNNLCFDIK